MVVDLDCDRFVDPVELTQDEREQLQAWARRATTAQAQALRSRIVLACADHLDHTKIKIAERISLFRGTWESGATGSWPSGWRD